MAEGSDSSIASAFLDGVVVASLALMAEVTWQLARASVMDGVTFGLALASAIALLRYRVNSAWIILFGAVVSLAVRAVRGY